MLGCLVGCMTVTRGCLRAVLVRQVLGLDLNNLPTITATVGSLIGLAHAHECIFVYLIFAAAEDLPLTKSTKQQQRRRTVIISQRRDFEDRRMCMLSKLHPSTKG